MDLKRDGDYFIITDHHDVELGRLEVDKGYTKAIVGEYQQLAALSKPMANVFLNGILGGLLHMTITHGRMPYVPKGGPQILRTD